MGRGGGAAEPRKSKSLKKINKGSISRVSKIGREQQKATMLTMTAYVTNTMADRKISGYLLSLVNIFLMILPLHV
jgi:hypothetical protein